MSSAKPLVTVIIPCYNAMEYLDIALDSILQQTYTNLEILTIDDGSSDGTFDYLIKASEKNTRIKVLKNEKNLGLIDTLNKGVNLASGEYIARMDADDISSPNRIELLLNHLQKRKCDVVSGNFDYIKLNGDPFRNNILRPIHDSEIKFASFFFTPIGHAMLIGKREVFLRHPYEKSNHSLHTEDYELWSRMIRNKVSLENLDRVVYSIRINPKSVSFKHEELQKRNFADCAKMHYEFYFNKIVTKRIYDVVVNRFYVIEKKQLNDAFTIIDEIADTFQEKPNNPTFKLITNSQKADILIQSIKISKGTKKITFGLKFFTLVILNLSNSKFRKYISSKF